ncbi:hypothetical protein J6E39_02355 [bacterium]|nr:hypothetical protein [bacterium]
MKIYPITSYNNNIHSITSKKKENNYNSTTKSQQYFDTIPNIPHYVPFTGGKSLNLSQTIKQLDFLSEKNNRAIYPPQIREWAGMILEEGNKENKTLIDIHKDYFKKLEECFSLDEVKRNFKEFENVRSDKDVNFIERSFVNKVKNGENEFFDKDEDLSLQILKLYWGQGFSTSDLKKYTDGLDLYHTMLRLNIPRVDKDYGHYLKFSDVNYNERLTKEMTAKRLEALDKKAQLESGEPVYIRTGRHLSPEHKKHISEGLIKHYIENPDAAFAISERQKQYFKENPDQAEIFKRVTTKAWNVFGADRIKKALSQYMKSHGFKDFDEKELLEPLSLSKPKSDTMKSFWGINDWAKKMFSKNMTYAWKKVKEENAIVYRLKTVPSQLVKFAEGKAGLKAGSLDTDSRYNPFLKTSSIDEISNSYMKKYTNIAGLENVMADTYQMSILKMAGELHDLPIDKKSKSEQDFRILLYSIMSENFKSGTYKVQTTEEARRDYIALAACAIESRNEKLINVVNNSLDRAFDEACRFHSFILK